jgi:predicted MFS family arabinose efflux permease
LNPTHPLSVPRREGRLLLVLAGIQVTHILDFMIMMPLGPQLIRALGISTHEFGLLLSSYTFTAAASGLLAAAYVDRFDRRKLMLTLYILFVVATLACGLAQGFASLLVARAAAGAFGGILGALVQTVIADVIPFERRGQAMGKIMAAFAVSTVAGVPLGLLLAEHLPALGWRAPFFFIVFLALAIWLAGYRVLPSLTAHMHRPKTGNAFQQLFSVAKQPAHLQAFAFLALLMLTSFSIIPYIALFYTANLGMTESFITLAYLVGGAATLFSSQWIGRLADRHGKLATFRWVALAALAPILITTNLVPLPAWVVLLNSTVFFVLVSGRMIPGMAMLTAVAAPHVRGSFMSLGSSVQMFASGVATLVAGLIITRDAAGQVLHYDVVGYLAACCGIASLWMAHRLKQAPPEPDRLSGQGVDPARSGNGCR